MYYVQGYPTHSLMLTPRFNHHIDQNKLLSSPIYHSFLNESDKEKITPLSHSPIYQSLVNQIELDPKETITLLSKANEIKHHIEIELNPKETITLLSKANETKHRIWIVIPKFIVNQWYMLSLRLANILHFYIYQMIEKNVSDWQSQSFGQPIASPISIFLHNLARKIVCCLPIIGSWPTKKSEILLREGIINKSVVAFKVPTLFQEGELAIGGNNIEYTMTLINTKNGYKMCSIARAVLSAAMTVAIVALAVFTADGNKKIISNVGYATSVVAGAIIAQQLFDIYKNNELKNKFNIDNSIDLDMIR